MKQAEQAILTTIAYSDIFAFPLTKEELWSYLLSDRQIERSVFDDALKSLASQITYQSGYYALDGQAALIKKRLTNTKEVKRKMTLAKRAAYYLSFIPTIHFIGISGSLAMGNVSTVDDIDFFIITKRNTLFMSRLWIQAILELLGLRRKRLEEDPFDKICVNLLIDETKIAWPKDKHDVYTAHEIMQIKPLFERQHMYERFITKNAWVKQFAPNAFEKKVTILGSSWKQNYVTLNAISALLTLKPFEFLLRVMQKRIMSRHQTTEIITKRVLAFHPNDYRLKTLSELNMKLRVLGLLTNK